MLIWIVFLGKVVAFFCFVLVFLAFYRPDGIHNLLWGSEHEQCVSVYTVLQLLIVPFDWFFQELDLFTFTPPSVSWARCWMSWLFSGSWCVLLPCGSLGDTCPEFFGMIGNHTIIHVHLFLECFLNLLMLTPKPAHNGTVSIQLYHCCCYLLSLHSLPVACISAHFVQNSWVCSCWWVYAL